METAEKEKTAEKPYCPVCKFTRYNSAAAHAITCAPRKSQRLRQYADYLLENEWRHLSCRADLVDENDDLVEDQAVTPFPGEITGDHNHCVVCYVNLFSISTPMAEKKVYYSGHPFIYRLCYKCDCRGEELVEGLVTLADTRRFILLLCLRRAFPWFYRIRDMRRFLCEYVF